MDLNEINDEINRLKSSQTTYSNVEKLAMLHMAQSALDSGNDRNYSFASAPLIDNRSEFLLACDGKDFEHILQILDEHMEVIKVIYPKEYDLILKKIKS